MFRNTATGVIIVIYVDDVLVIARLLTSITETARLIETVFPLRPLSEIYYYLGIRVIRNRESRQLIVVQDAYLDKIATKFNLARLYPAASGALLSKEMATKLRSLGADYFAPNKLKTEY